MIYINNIIIDMNEMKDNSYIDTEGEGNKCIPKKSRPILSKLRKKKTVLKYVKHQQ